jgi:hypothetical protein
LEKKNFQQLQFFPLLNWPTSLPSISIGNVIVAGFDLYDNQSLHQLNYESPEKTSQQFFEIHPLLTLPEIARVIHHPQSEGWLHQDRLIQHYGFYPSPDFYSVCQLLVQLPLDFQNLVGIKKMGPSELLPLLSLDLTTLTKVTESIIEKSESKSDTAKRIEWLSDLILMNHSIDDLLPKSLNQLHALRFPEATKRDESLKNTNLPWSGPIKTKMHRKGDAAGFDVQFFAGSPVELEKIADTLKKVASSWNSNLQ